MSNKRAPGSLSNNYATKVRSAVTAAESTTLNDTNFVPGDAMAGQAWKRVLVYPRFVGGASPTVTIQPLYRAGSIWVTLTKTSPLASGEGATIDVYGRDVFLRVDALTGAPTSVDVYAAGWEPFIFGGSASR